MYNFPTGNGYGSGYMFGHGYYYGNGYGYGYGIIDWVKVGEYPLALLVADI